jgi:hypothetical protein
MPAHHTTLQRADGQHIQFSKHYINSEGSDQNPGTVHLHAILHNQKSTILIKASTRSKNK